MSGPCIDISRAVLAERAIREKAEVLVWIDADMIFSPSTCENVARQAGELSAVVGCLYSGKKSEALPQVALIEDRNLTCFKGGELVEVKAIGFGLVAHPVSMLERIAERLALPRQKCGRDSYARPWFTGDPRWESMHSDDYAFCRRAREAGFKIFADTRERVGHLGEYEYHLEDLAARTIYESLEIVLEREK